MTFFNEPCRDHMCAQCARNFDKLVDGLLRQLYPKVAVMKEVLSKYSMRNDSDKFTKIIQKHLNINDLVDKNKDLTFDIKFPNNYLTYEISELENRIAGNEAFRFSDTLKEGEAYVQLVTVCRATLCDKCYTLYRYKPAFITKLTRLYFRCSNVNTIYNHLSKRPDLVKALTDKCKPGKQKFSDVVKGRLFEFKDEEHKFIHPDWKGTDYHFRKIFGVPLLLSGIVPSDHFGRLHSRYFNDVIAGHPKASNGWMRDAMDEMEDDGIFT